MVALPKTESSDPFAIEEFQNLLPLGFEELSSIAVGLSGGPDSMALTKLLSLWSASVDGPNIHALIVDHGLRKEAAEEARSTLEQVQDWPKVTAEILNCDLAEQETRLMEAARDARYAVLAQYCSKNTIQHLCLGHHREDQAETFLFRLAKGSGLDGLSAIRPEQEYGGLTLVRPLLVVPKQALIETCETYNVPFIQDPSNESEDFARVRLRQSADILAEEGLTSKRLESTARRLNRAREALESMSDKVFDEILLEKDTCRIVFNMPKFQQQLDELALRIISKAIRQLNPDEDYLPRMEKIEDLCADLKSQTPFRKRTLGGLIFECKDKDDHLIITKEK